MRDLPRKVKKQGGHPRMIYQIDATRTRILDEAWKIFIARGFFDTRMQEIAQTCELSRTSLYRYFRDKLDLGTALVERAFDVLNHDEHWRTGLEQDVFDLIESYLLNKWCGGRHREILLFLAEFDSFFSGSRIPEDFTERIAEATKARGDPTLEDMLARAVNEGLLPKETDLALVSVTLINSVRGLSQRLHLRARALVELAHHKQESVIALQIKLLMQGLKKLTSQTGFAPAVSESNEV